MGRRGDASGSRRLGLSRGGCGGGGDSGGPWCALRMAELSVGWATRAEKGRTAVAPVTPARDDHTALRCPVSSSQVELGRVLQRASSPSHGAAGFAPLQPGVARLVLAEPCLERVDERCNCAERGVRSAVDCEERDGVVGFANCQYVSSSSNAISRMPSTAGSR